MSYEVFVGLIAIFVTILIQALCIAYKMGKFEEKLIDIENERV